MTELDFSQRVVVPEDTLFREIEGESVILSLETQNYYGLDPVGTRMWNLLAGSASIQAAYEQLLEEYEVDEKTLGADITELLSKLVEQKLVRLEVPTPRP